MDAGYGKDEGPHLKVSSTGLALQYNARPSGFTPYSVVAFLAMTPDVSYSRTLMVTFLG